MYSSEFTKAAKHYLFAAQVARALREICLLLSAFACPAALHVLGSAHLRAVVTEAVAGQNLLVCATPGRCLSLATASRAHTACYLLARVFPFPLNIPAYNEECNRVVNMKCERI